MNVKEEGKEQKAKKNETRFGISSLFQLRQAYRPAKEISHSRPVIATETGFALSIRGTTVMVASLYAIRAVYTILLPRTYSSSAEKCTRPKYKNHKLMDKNGHRPRWRISNSAPTITPKDFSHPVA